VKPFKDPDPQVENNAFVDRPNHLQFSILTLNQKTKDVTKNLRSNEEEEEDEQNLTKLKGIDNFKNADRLLEIF